MKLLEVQAGVPGEQAKAATGPPELLARVGVSAYNPNSAEFFQQREREVMLVEGKGEQEEEQEGEGELTDDMLKKAAEGLDISA